MYRLMIVDDESVFRDGLQQNIDWAGSDVEVVAEAQNGLDALSKIEQTSPDIVLTDIRMPEMDGLELAEQLRLRYPRVIVIMLTVMDDFQNVRRSLQVRAIDYVLKFNYRTETLPAVTKACRMIDREKVILAETAKLPYTDYGFLRECILGNIDADEALFAVEHELPKLKGLRSAAVLACLPGANLQDETTLVLLLQSELKHIGIDELKSYIVNLGERVCLTLFLPELDKNELLKLMRTAIRRVRRRRESYAGMRIGVGELKENAADLAESYAEAELAFNAANATQTDLVFHYNLRDDPASYQLLLQQSAEYIDRHYQEHDFGLRDVAARFFLSPSYFSTIFKKSFGTGFNDYLTNIRLNHAKSLLRDTSLKTYEIAEQVGYSSPQYMSILFRRYLGCSPIEYRRAARGEDTQDE
jgi:two-component system response regulator YesN